MCSREASSGTTPPKASWASWLAVSWAITPRAGE
jgi:hypothetical protein